MKTAGSGLISPSLTIPGTLVQERGIRPGHLRQLIDPVPMESTVGKQPGRIGSGGR